MFGGVSGFFGNVAVQNQDDPAILAIYTVLCFALLGLAVLAACMETIEDAKLKAYADLQGDRTRQILEIVQRTHDRLAVGPAEKVGAPEVPESETLTTEQILELLGEADGEEEKPG